ncbi:MAG: hypothetical protein FWB95_08130 [Treponema sp.]|nr:hypothetical protein [Treponema sp.]
MNLFGKGLSQRHGEVTRSCANAVKRAGFSVVLALVLVFGAMFISCNNEPDDPGEGYVVSAMPEILKGTWKSDYDEIFIINNDTFTSKYGDFVTYTGTVAGHRSNNDGAGYITIKYTENSGFVDSVNKFYVIHYKDLSDSAVTLAGGSLSSDPDFEYGVGPGGKTTQAEAEAVMTVSAGYFEWYSFLSKVNN